MKNFMVVFAVVLVVALLVYLNFSTQQSEPVAVVSQSAILHSDTVTTTTKRPKISLGDTVQCVRRLGGRVVVPDTHLRENLILVFEDKPEAKEMELQLLSKKDVLGLYVVKYDGTDNGWQEKVNTSGSDIYVTIWRSDFERARDRLRSSSKCKAW